MTRLVFLGGFLGSGKTTTLLRLAGDLIRNGHKVGVVTNDQGHDLVDTELFRGSKLATRDVRGGCFCCRLDDFVAQADELSSATQPDFILAEPVGSCTDLAATVLRPLRALYGGRYTIGPFAALVDPNRAKDVLSRDGRATLSEKVTYVYKLQQLEADAIAMNKADLLNEAERTEIMELLQSQFPAKRVFTFSARTGEGFSELATYLLGPSEGISPKSPPIDYDVYAAGESELAWFDGRFAVFAPNPIEMDAALMRLALRLCGPLTTVGEIAHVKLLLQARDHVSAISMTGSGSVAEFARRASTSAASLRLLVNARVAGSPAHLRSVVEDGVLAWSSELGLTPTSETALAFSPPRPVPTHRID